MKTIQSVLDEFDELTDGELTVSYQKIVKDFIRTAITEIVESLEIEEKKLPYSKEDFEATTPGALTSADIRNAMKYLANNNQCVYQYVNGFNNARNEVIKWKESVKQ